MQFICISLPCRDQGATQFSSEETKPICPKCGYANAIRRVTLVHLLVQDLKGPIQGDGANYRVACGKDHKLVLNATGEPLAANCPKCLATISSQVSNLQDAGNRETTSHTST